MDKLVDIKSKLSIQFGKNIIISFKFEDETSQIKTSDIADFIEFIDNV